MDFLDVPNFATVDKAVYAGFLGIGNKKKAATSASQGSADLQNRFPFSDNCETQKKIVKALQDESAQTLASRNSSKGSTRVQLSGRLDAYDAYIPAAIAHMNNVSCLKPAGNNALEIEAQLAAKNAGKSNNQKTIILAGVGIAVLIGAVILIRKKMKK